MYENCEALILRRVKFSETSLIVTLFTREFGRVDALAKGARRPKSALCGHFDFLAHEEVTLFRRPRSGLDLITAAAGFSDFPQLRRVPARFAAAAIIAEIILVACQPHDPHPQLFTGAITAWQDLNHGAEILPTLLHCLSDLLPELGFAPRLEACVICEKIIAEKAMLSPAHGGLVCATCGGINSDCNAHHKLPPSRLWLHRGNIATLRNFRERKIRQRLDDGLIILRTLERYLQFVCARELKSFRLFYELNG